MKLQTKVIIGILPLALVSIFALGLWSIQMSKNKTHEYTYRYMNAEIDSYIANSVARLNSLLVKSGLDQVESFKKGYRQRAAKLAGEIPVPETGYFFVLDVNGDLIFSSISRGSEALKATLETAIQATIRNSDGITDGRTIIQEDNELFVSRYFQPWGWVVFFAISEDEIHASDKLIRNATFAMAAVCGLGLILVIFVALRRLFVQPINTLKMGAEKIARGEELATIEVKSNDELGDLARSMEAMSSSISEYRTKQASWQKHLEQEVLARTEQLNTSNNSLKLEIIERTKAEEQYREIFNSSSDALLVINMSGNIVDANPVACEMYGYYYEELINLTPERLIHEDDFHKFEEFMNSPQVKNERVDRSSSLRKDETQFNVEVKITSFEYDGEKHLLFAIKDITLQERMEEEKERLQAQLQQAQKMEAIGTLAGGIAHDFNNILTAIVGFTEIALNNELPRDSSARHSLNQVLKGGNRAKDLVRQILAFSRHEEEVASPVKIIPLVKEALKLLRSTIPVTIDIRQDLNAKADTVNCNSTRIHQILMNLCTNALQSMPQERGVLTVKLTDTYLDSTTVEEYSDLVPGPYLRLSISDTGRGIEPGIRDHIFEPYFTTKGVGEGTGLGLAVAHGIIKSFHGDIVVESELGRGSTFHILLPVFEQETYEKPVSPEYYPKGNERILFIDDETDIVEMRAKSLEGLGYSVAAYTDPLKALEAFKASVDKFDLVMTDMTMPKMTGDVLAREIQKERPDIAIVLCTGFSNLITSEKAEQLGIKGFITKPSSLSEIALTIRRILDNSK